MKLLLQDHRELEMIGKDGHRDQFASNLLLYTENDNGGHLGLEVM
jgi:hypothetical protein